MIIKNSYNRALKDIGYLKDQKGIMNRFLDEAENWSAHLINTKNYIINFLRKNHRKTIAVLGSGWLLDIPMQFLIERTEKVYLIDICHPSQIKHKYRNEDKIEFMEMDITGGGIFKVYNSVYKYKKTGEVTQPEDFEFEGLTLDKSVDVVLSVNILNQLDILLTDYLKKFNIYSTNELKQLRFSIQKSHIESIRKYNGCLITDYKEIVEDLKHNKKDENSLVSVNIPNGKNKKEWVWKFDMTGTYYPGKKVIFKVFAIEFIKDA